MFLQTVIKVVYQFLIPKFVEDWNWLWPSGFTETDSASTLHVPSTQRAHKPSEMINMEQRGPNYTCLHPLNCHVWVLVLKAFENFIRSPKLFLNSKSLWERERQFADFATSLINKAKNVHEGW